MDETTRSHYELLFKIAFLEKKGDDFQNFFSNIMEMRYPGDFVRTRPWGNIGDRKSDGYLRSKRMLFQVYAPNELELSKTLAKIEEDFNGALPFWEEYFDTWVFVHNSRIGLASDVLAKLLHLEKSNEPLKTPNWGFVELRQEFFGLSNADIVALLGPPVSKEMFTRLGFKELEPVLLHITRSQSPIEVDPRPVSIRKLEANGLSGSVANLLNAGRLKSRLVENFFQKYHDPTLGDQVAESFKREYVQLRETTSDPDKIFTELQVFAGGSRIGLPGHQEAVYTVLTYLFDSCDIFERPREDRL